ncbi:glutamine--fructose-6-phosphate transaminase (isomerizing) [Ructibacterium gallinarum]|uniref:Glutamine--fructose-6-phosphate aminotransferase [isomerizing] n=1 Tax=Ructibacterium gallinarum TaxID=2779355 RepID=A0A9D5M2V2_9FIRM|nr:glutamine--fructose-6-phosphate transaminase (isomerizing) [Ructibacterium gallinarum]MBE5039605.1 glutamine--fructose-6-phosphate transaminase (isomerizing) [Ructibacterium gallinarum]
MCGIVGYVGKKQAAPILLDGLRKLEYRGYDSAGVAVMTAEGINVQKAKGRLSVLEKRIDGGKLLKGTMGIGHTRWATHGEPSDTNSHPHLSRSGRFAVVHNGIIENYIKLREYLTKKGFTFLSETDTEVIAHLVEYYYQGDIIDTITKVMNKVEGSYALGILCADNPDQFVAVRKESPLIVGLGKDENFIASDIPAILAYTRDVYFLENNEIVVLRADEVKIYNTDRESVQKEIFHVDWDISAAEKGGYEHFMFKEIMEQPKALQDTISPRIKDGRIVLDDITLSKEYIDSIDKIYIVACGSAYHVGVVGKYVIEKMLRLPVEVSVASEFRYMQPIVNEKTLVVVISQSGETADTIAAMREAKRLGARTFAIVNAVGSAIAREADDVLYTWAGPEIAVATTKAYSTQLTAIYLLAIYMAQHMNCLTQEQIDRYINALQTLPEHIAQILEHKEEIQYTASLHYNSKSIFFLGRTLDYAVALEGSLKLKEISYIHSEAYAAGELKHGTIALIEQGTVVVALCTVKELFEKMLSNIKEVKARGAVVIAVAEEGQTAIEQEADHIIYVPHCDSLVMPSEVVVPLQLFAYYVASLKGLDIDKPRNLAKSVTVE